jgi:hypothetical protein
MLPADAMIAARVFALTGEQLNRRTITERIERTFGCDVDRHLRDHRRS